MEKYSYPGGEFVNVGNGNWEEWQNGQSVFRFIETGRDNNQIILNDASRNIQVALPIDSGKSYYAIGNSNWVELYDVVKNYTPAGTGASSIDAGILWNNGKAYFFKDDKYIRVNVAPHPNNTTDPGYPKPIAGNWPGWPPDFTQGIDAAVAWNNGKAYFFKGNRYIRVNMGPSPNDAMDPGYPKPIAGNWPGWPPDFLQGIDAAVPWNTGKAYFFKGSRYIRVNMGAPPNDAMDPGYPQPIAGNWPGWPPDFLQGIDAGVPWSTGKAYFFKGDRYIRVNMAPHPHNTMDKDYPKPIAGNWPGWPKNFHGTPTPPGMPKTDPPDHNHRNWFFPVMPQSQIRDGNDVVAFIEGTNTYKGMVDAIKSTKNSEHFIYLLGWDLQIDFELIPGDNNSTIKKLFTEASNKRKVQIRAMLNYHQAIPGYGSITSFNNKPPVDFINSLTNGAAIQDGKYLNAGSHHQKILIVYGQQGLFAFSGGIDINDNRHHRLHDVHCSIKGPAAWDHYQVFVKRWGDNMYSNSIPINTGLSKPGKAGNKYVQLALTYGNGNKHPGIDIVPNKIPPTPKGYSFAPDGDQSAKMLILQAISNTENFIYLEDQYLVDMSISRALARKLPSINLLIILIPHTNSVNGELKQGWKRRKAFIDKLTKKSWPKVIVCYNTKVMVHSKMWIFDDKFAIIGSANCNRRGYTHDSEQVVGIFDPNDSGNLYLPHELRMNLWSKHLNLPPASFLDPIASSLYWRQPPPSAKIAKYDPNAGKDNPPLGLGTDVAWNTLIDPDGS